MRRLRGLLQLATFAAYGCAGPALPASGTAPTQAPPSARPAAVTGHDATNTHSRSATLNEQLALRRLMRDTEKLRGRRFSQPVELRIEDRVGMRAYAARALDEDDLVRAKRRYVALGLLPADLDLRRLLEELLEDELVGYYDPRSKRLVVRDDVARVLERSARDDAALAFDETLVHELVHALQDQHLGLSRHLDGERTTDADNAYAALVEGDAQLVMYAYALAARGRDLGSLLAGGDFDAALTAPTRGLGAAMARAPALIRETLLFRYREGARYAARLYAEGGFARIDRAHASPPETTAQVLDALHHRPFRAPRAVPALPEHTCTAQLGFATHDHDSLGALEAGIALEDMAHGALHGTSALVESDHYALLERAGAVASVWVLHMTTPAAAAAAQQQLARRQAGGYAVRAGSRVLATLGLPDACAAALGAQFTRARPMDTPAR